jgi:hypothetical protein
MFCFPYPEIDFVNASPSSVATAALVTAVRSVLPHQSHVSWSRLLHKAEEITGIACSGIDDLVQRIGHVVATAEPALKQQSSHSVATANSTKNSLLLAHKSVICNPPHQMSATPETPTDVQDILF